MIPAGIHPNSLNINYAGNIPPAGLFPFNFRFQSVDFQQNHSGKIWCGFNHSGKFGVIGEPFTCVSGHAPLQEQRQSEN